MSQNVPFTANQIKFIEWLATPGDSRHPPTQEMLADQLGLSRKTLYRWKQESALMDAVINRSRELLRSDLPEIYAALAREAKKGKFPHIKLAMEMTEQHIDQLNIIGLEGLIKKVWGDADNSD